MIIDEQAEKSLIGSLMQHPEPVPYLLSLTEDDMVFEDDKIILTTMQRLAAKREPFDKQVIIGEVTRDPRYSTSTLQAILESIRLSPTTVLTDSYFKRVKELSNRRTLQSIAQSLANKAQDMGAEVETTVSEVMDELRRIGGTQDKWRDMAVMAMAAYEDVERLSKGEVNYLPTGIAVLDKAISGLFPGEVTVLGARPAVGKSAMASYIGARLASQGKAVGICSLEMSPIQYLKRLMAAYSGVEGKKLRTGQGITTDEWERLGDACSELAGWNMPFTFSVKTIEELAAEARRRKDSKGLDLLIVDYMQLLKVQRPVESDFVRVSTVSHEIKRLALDLDIPILALAQVTRPESKGKLTMPTLDTLRGSGDIEQDADNVLFLHRPESPADDSINPKHASVAEACMREKQNQYVVLNIAKQRNGTNRMIDMIFDPAHMTYRCWAD